MLSLDLAGIIAGSGIRGQFEEKFKALLKDIEAEVKYLLPREILILMVMSRVGKRSVLLMNSVNIPPIHIRD